MTKRIYKKIVIIKKGFIRFLKTSWNCFIWFCKKYTWIFAGTILSIWIILKTTKIPIIFEMDCDFLRAIFEYPEENYESFYAFDILKNLSYSYIAAFIFFLFQVIVPNKKKEDIILIDVKKYNKKILRYIETVYWDIVKAVYDNTPGDVFDEEIINGLSGKQKNVKDNEKYCSYAISFLDKIEMSILQCKTLYINYLSENELDAYNEIDEKILNSITALYLRGNVRGISLDLYMLPSDIKDFKNAYEKMSKVINE